MFTERAYAADVRTTCIKITWNSLGAEELSVVTILEACSTEMPSTVTSSGSWIVTRPSLPAMAQQAPRLLSSEITDSTGPMLRKKKAQEKKKNRIHYKALATDRVAEHVGGMASTCSMTTVP